MLWLLGPGVNCGPDLRSPHVWILLFSLVGSGCGGGSSGECNIPTCSFAISTFHLESGTISWTVNGGLARSANIASAANPTGDCELTMSPGKIGAATNPADRQFEPASLELACGLAGSGLAHVDASTAAPSWSMQLRYSADPRSWTAEQSTSVEASGSEFCLFLSGGDASSTLTGAGVLIGPAPMSVSVEAATGGAADFPTVVTADFYRKVHLEYTASGLWLADAATCGSGLATLSLELSQVAADYSVEQGRCYKSCN
jgi:hypothetical protein